MIHPIGDPRRRDRIDAGAGTAFAALAWIVGIHQIEANLLNPKIYGIAAKIHPVLVIFSLLLGEHFFGLVGALLAVPCMSIVQNTFLHFRTVALGADAPTDTFAGFPIPKVAADMKAAKEKTKEKKKQATDEKADEAPKEEESSGAGD